ncbi:MAG: class I SAM-dependent methyltransferase [Actinomycetota bacterium]|nr:class I SAM-dependent methyltransferase [Actinomycetota bacterium]
MSTIGEAGTPVGLLAHVGITGDEIVQDDVLEDLAGAHRYRQWLVGLATPHLGDDPLEIGSGLGDHAADWAASGLARLTASEADVGRVAALRARFRGDPVVRVRALTAPVTESGAHSAVVAYNVLEHIPDDQAALRAFAGLLRPGGALVLLVPAFPSAMSDFDRAVGHQRRYRRRDLAAALRAAGLEVRVLHHVNSLGLLAWYVVMVGLRRKPRMGLLLKVYDVAVVPWLRRLETWQTPPFGQSLFAVARKPS